MDETRPLTKEEALSIIEDIQNEIKSEKVAGLGIIVTNIVSTQSQSPLIFSSHVVGKQILFALHYEETTNG